MYRKSRNFRDKTISHGKFFTGHANVNYAHAIKFTCLIFVVRTDYENTIPAKISRFTVPCSLHEWGASSLGLVVDGGVPQDEKLHHVLMTLPAGEGQRSVVIAARRHVDLGTRVEEKLGSLKMTLSVSKG